MGKFDAIFSDLIVIEGGDGAGKGTQANYLLNRLLDKGINAKLLDFPDYKSETGQLVQSMLNGHYGNNAKDLNPYFTSPMYSLDRYQYLQRLYEDNVGKPPMVGICNRYTMSNLIHQGARIEDPDEFIKYWNWLYDYEFIKLGLPKPTAVIYLDIPYRIARENVLRRSKEEGRIIDINESIEYMEMVSANVSRIIGITDWISIQCYKDCGVMRSIDDIAYNIDLYLKDINVSFKDIL